MVEANCIRTYTQLAMGFQLCMDYMSMYTVYINTHTHVYYIYTHTIITCVYNKYIDNILLVTGRPFVCPKNRCQKKQGEHAEADHAQGPAVGPAQNTEVITKLLPQWIGFLGKI